MQLLQKGIVLNSNPGQGLAYKFTGLNSIKPDMITEATRNARAAADRFASDSGSRVGSIRQANQGVFTLFARGSEQRHWRGRQKCLCGRFQLDENCSRGHFRAVLSRKVKHTTHNI